MEDITEMWPHQLDGHIKMLQRRIEWAEKEKTKFLWSECHICSHKDIAKEDIPQEWGWVVGYPALICDVCIEAWNERFGNCETTRGGEL